MIDFFTPLSHEVQHAVLPIENTSILGGHLVDFASSRDGADNFPPPPPR